MTKPGRKAGTNMTAEVREHLRKNSLKWITIKDLLVAGFGNELSEEQLRSKLSYLVKGGQAKRSGRGDAAKWKYVSNPKPKTVKVGDGLGIGTSIHKQVEAYIADSDLPQVALDVRASQIVDEVPLDEPDGTFRVQGSLIDGFKFKGTVVRMTSPGWSDRPYLITEL